MILIEWKCSHETKSIIHRNYRLNVKMFETYRTFTASLRMKCDLYLNDFFCCCLDSSTLLNHCEIIPTTAYVSLFAPHVSATELWFTVSYHNSKTCLDLRWVNKLVKTVGVHLWSEFHRSTDPPILRRRTAESKTLAHCLHHSWHFWMFNLSSNWI